MSTSPFWKKIKIQMVQRGPPTKANIGWHLLFGVWFWWQNRSFSHRDLASEATQRSPDNSNHKQSPPCKVVLCQAQSQSKSSTSFVLLSHCVILRYDLKTVTHYPIPFSSSRATQIQPKYRLTELTLCEPCTKSYCLAMLQTLKGFCLIRKVICNYKCYCHLK